MKCLGQVGVVLLVTLSLVSSKPSDTTTARLPPIGETLKKVSNQLMDINSTTSDLVAFDTRTPPKIKQQLNKKKYQIETIENSHAGVAIPVVDEDSILDVEETTKKLSFYKIERPTTNSGLSTWILLSGQAATTTKAPKKPVIKPLDETKNVTLVVTENPNRIIKPVFKKRVTTTRRPTTSKSTTVNSNSNVTLPIPSTTIRSTTKATKDGTKLTKIKASVLNNAVNKKNVTTTKKQQITTTSATEKTISTTAPSSSTTTIVVSNGTLLNGTDSNALPAEAKDGELELEITTENKKRKTNKRKKNKTRRRKPASDKLDGNSTKLEKHKPGKEKPIGTQLYNYLSREVMPTVGVGLVGLMVTAGLASYFLYPFGIARRSYEVDRRDKEGNYYYNDQYSGGIAEEEAIGKVIAGMPANSLNTQTYKTPTSRNTYSNVRYRQVDYREPQGIAQEPQGIVQGSVEAVNLTPKEKTSYETNNPYALPQVYQPENYQPVVYNKQVFEQNQETGYTVGDDQKFVVGNVPKEIMEEATPAVVPEHGPRSLRIRRRRRRSDDSQNEIDNELGSSFETTTAKDDTTTIFPDYSSTTTIKYSSTTESLTEKYTSFMHLMKDLLHLKVKLGLQLIQNATQTISTYVSKVQTRLDDHYRNYTRNRH